MNANKGFTLIEMLVVVLIIGVLAAIAWPYYGVAVENSRSTEAFTNLKALEDAQREYYLSNGLFTNDLSLLSVSLPESGTFEYYCKEERFCQANNTGKILFEVTFSQSYDQYAAHLAGKRFCIAFAEDPFYEKVCASLGGQQFSQSWHGNSYFELP